MKALDRLRELAERSGGQAQARLLYEEVANKLEGRRPIRCTECDVKLTHVITRGVRRRSRWFCSDRCANLWESSAKPYLRICPELYDGQHWVLADPSVMSAAFGDYLANDPQDGDDLTVTCVLLSDAQIERMPEV